MAAGLTQFTPLHVDDSLFLLIPVAAPLPAICQPRRPEHALMRAVLEQAWHDLHTPRHAHPQRSTATCFACRHGQILRDDARDWFRSDARGWEFSFANIADSLGLSITAVRREVGKLSR